MTPAPPPTLSDRFALIIEVLCRTLAAQGHARRLPPPLIRLLYSRLRRAATRFAALAARVRAGTLAPPRPRAPRPRSGPPRPRQRLPDRYAWLVRLIPGHAACHGTQLGGLLTDPEMQAFLQAAPQAGRILRPICRMLATNVPAYLQLPRRPARPKPARPEPASAEQPAQAAPPDAEPFRPTRAGPLLRKPRGPAPPGTVWRRWRGIWMPEPIRPEMPAEPGTPKHARIVPIQEQTADAMRSGDRSAHRHDPAGRLASAPHRPVP